MQEPVIQGVISGHALDLCGIQQQAPARLGYVGEADTGETGNVLAGILAVHAVLERDGLRPDRSAVIAYDAQDALHKGAFAVPGGFAVEEEHALEPGIAADGVAECLLQEPGLVHIAVHDLADEPGIAFTPGTGT